VRRRLSRAVRRLLCRVGVHRWQILYEPPKARGERYRKAVYCVACNVEAPFTPGEFGVG